MSKTARIPATISSSMDQDDWIVRYGIWQLKRLDVDEVNRSGFPDDYWGFMDYDFALSHGFNKAAYEWVYDGAVMVRDDDIENGEEPEFVGDVDRLLDKIFSTLNANRPSDFTGHSLSVSDIIVVGDEAYYVNDIGFEKLDGIAMWGSHIASAPSVSAERMLEQISDVFEPDKWWRIDWGASYHPDEQNNFSDGQGEVEAMKRSSSRRKTAEFENLYVRTIHVYSDYGESDETGTVLTDGFGHVFAQLSWGEDQEFTGPDDARTSVVSPEAFAAARKWVDDECEAYMEDVREIAEERPDVEVYSGVKLYPGAPVVEASSKTVRKTAASFAFAEYSSIKLFSFLSADGHECSVDVSVDPLGSYIEMANSSTIPGTIAGCDFSVYVDGSKFHASNSFDDILLVSNELVELGIDGTRENHVSSRKTADAERCVISRGHNVELYFDEVAWNEYAIDVDDYDAVQEIANAATEDMSAYKDISTDVYFEVNGVKCRSWYIAREDTVCVKIRGLRPYSN